MIPQGTESRSSIVAKLCCFIGVNMDFLREKTTTPELLNKFEFKLKCEDLDLRHRRKNKSGCSQESCFRRPRISFFGFRTISLIQA